MKSQSLKQAYKTVILGCSSMKTSIPSEWEVKSIESCCDILDNLRKPLNESDRSKIKGYIPYYGANGVLDYINDYIFDEKLILVAEDGGYFDEYRTRPIAYRIDGRAWVNNHAHVLRTKSGVNSDWVFYNLVHRNLIPLVNGSTRSKLNGSELRIIKLPMPPLQEQQKIASILSKVDELIQKTDEIIEQTQRLKKGLVQKLLTRGTGHQKFKAHKFEMLTLDIPDDWLLKSFEGIVSSYKNGIYKLPEYYGRGFPSIRMFNIVNGKIDPTGAPLLDVSQEELYDYELRTGDILVNRVNTAELVGKTGIVDRDLGKVTFESKNIRVRVKNSCLPEFLAYFMNSNLYYMQIRASIKRAIGQSTINQSDLNRVLVPLPPIEEQKKIVSILVKIDVLAELEIKYRAMNISLKKGLMQKLLTGQIRVKV